MSRQKRNHGPTEGKMLCGLRREEALTFTKSKMREFENRARKWHEMPSHVMGGFQALTTFVRRRSAGTIGLLKILAYSWTPWTGLKID
jgi:hypothetical protein